ncbi:hypothetical protein CERSUDRAFT_120795, partial [Gelatoporia subvermispora B]
MQRTVELPVGAHPEWELDEVDEDGEQPELHSIPRSQALHQSLVQSRNKWLSTALPKFSAKARGGRPAEVVPPPHTIKAHGRFDVVIGPHTFLSTAFYEVHYMPQSLVEPTPSTSVPPHATIPAPQASSSTRPPSQTSATPSAQSTASQILSSLGVDTFVTPNLIAQVNSASRSNPTLAKLLQRAAVGQASTDELKTLGLLIQSLSTLQKADINTAAQIASAATQAVTATPLPPRDFDIVIEFHDKPSEKFIFPRGCVVCEREGPEDPRWRTRDVLVSTCLPFPSTIGGTEAQDIAPEVVTFRILRMYPALWDTLLSWTGGESQMKENKRRLREIKIPPRTYLQYRLPDGPILSQIEAALTQHSTKPVMPANADKVKAKRKAPPRKTALPGDDMIAAPEVTPKKRRQTTKVKPMNHPPRIACHVCGRTDVPLMMGGRYCRECIDAGKAVAAIPQVPSVPVAAPSHTSQ